MTQTTSNLDPRLQVEAIKSLITPEIIEEHKRKPIGQHSDALERVLIYLRTNHYQMQGKLIIVCTKPDEEWCLGELSGVRGQPPKIYRQECFSSREEAEHAVFLRRLRNLGLWDQ
jgi:branched-chain amino acid transport system permease protein